MQIKLSVLMVYARAVGLKVFILMLTINILHECSDVYLGVWISKWTNDLTASVNGTVDKGHNMRLVVYGAVGLVRGIFYTVHYILICQSFNVSVRFLVPFTTYL